MAALSSAPAVGVPRIAIADRIVKRLSEHAKSAFDGRQGFLYGYREDGAVSVVGCALSKSLTEKNFVVKFAKNSCYFPAGIDPVGIFVMGGQDTMRLRSILPSQDGNIDSLPSVLLAWFFPDGGSSQVHWYDVSTRSLSATTFTSYSSDAGLPSRLTFRVKGTVKVTVEHTSDASLSAPIASAFAEVKRRVSSSLASYVIPALGPLVLPNDSCTTKNEEGVHADDGSSAASELCGDVLAPERPQKRKGDTQSDDAVITVDLLFCLSTGDALEASRNCAPILFCDQKPMAVSTLCLPLDVLAVISRKEPLRHLPAVFQRGLLSQLECMQRTLTLYQNNNLSNAIPYHFKPPECLHYVTLIYCDNETDANLESYRKFVHQKLLLPMDRPLLRRINKCSLGESTVSAEDVEGGGEGQRKERSGRDGHLKNVHIGLPLSGVKEGRVSCVRGLYAYHHYMQDGMDDAGWGCAYRSLQTLISWFCMQGYVDISMPTHRQIQEALVAVGDKPPAFVGSKQWIGSVEVSYCLEKLLGVTSKILFVTSGADLPTKARELAQHFDNQWTPVMIGGGVLAHTILGIDYSDISGDIRFLVLDPHYTGGEDLKVIQDKGWCGWKGLSFWDKTAHYNLCMPQRPVAI